MNKGGRAKIDALLRHLANGQDLQDFPSTTYERLGLVETAGRRGLIEWQKEHGRYELTPIGWRQLTPRRGLGLPSLVVSTAVGAAIGAAALAILWLPAGALHRSVGEASAAAVSPLAGPVAAPASRPAEAGVRSPAPAPTASAAPANPTEPPAVVDQPVPEQPSAEAAPTDKPAATKRHHRRTAYRHKREQTGSTWFSADAWRTRQSRNSGRNGSGSWFAFR